MGSIKTLRNKKFLAKKVRRQQTPPAQQDRQTDLKSGCRPVACLLACVGCGVSPNVI